VFAGRPAEEPAAPITAVAVLVAARTALLWVRDMAATWTAHTIKGRVVDVGIHEELLARCEAYERLVRSQADTAVLLTGANEAASRQQRGGDPA
jgi:hypothetical protein